MIYHGIWYLCCGVYLMHCIADASQESCLGTVENSECTRDTYFYYKRYEWLLLWKIKQDVSSNIAVD